ncbi:MAG: hypothetical protein C4543_01385 [Ignavibacteriales bacterium]|jgi:iron complex transport system substrate-binding protein|nr:MAG: hypothetical protein C4543_01385 [Ignavibacteriales bacterium]
MDYMINLLQTLLFVLLFPIFLFSQSFSIDDDLDRSIYFDSIPTKVISLAPNITEMIYQLNVGDKLVGNTKYCYFPEDAKSVSKVGDILTINYEKIIELQPDVIFLTVEGNQKHVYEKLMNLGFKVFVSNPRDYEGIKKTFKDLGKVFGKRQLAKIKIQEWDSTLAQIKSDSKNFTRKTVMILVELNPIMIAGKNTFINTYIETCNMKNFSEEAQLNYPIFSRETVIERDPDIIVYPSSGKESIKTLTDTYPEWASLSAIKNNRVFFVDRDLYFRPGPRFIEALTDFYSRLAKTSSID